jgi:hypothetical protein
MGTGVLKSECGLNILLKSGWQRHGYGSSITKEWCRLDGLTAFVRTSVTSFASP